MIPNSLLIANRGEIAIRIIRAAAEMGIRTVAVFPEDDAASLHTRKADEARRLNGAGAAAYLDGEQIIALAKAAGCDAIHPGYGFLSENAKFARRCAERRNHVRRTAARNARAIRRQGAGARAGRAMRRADAAAALRVRPVSRGREVFFVAGRRRLDDDQGGRRRWRPRDARSVHRVEEIEEAYKRCQSEARASFGNGDVYVERLMPRARHIEVQIIGDGSGDVSHLWERECSIQRRNQKIVEIAPSPGLAPAMRDRLTAAAVRMAEEVRYDNLGTFEFLVDADTSAKTTRPSSRSSRPIRASRSSTR